MIYHGHNDNFVAAAELRTLLFCNYSPDKTVKVVFVCPQNCKQDDGEEGEMITDKGESIFTRQGEGRALRFHVLTKSVTTNPKIQRTLHL